MNTLNQKQVLKNIFKKLDNDYDGLISSQHIDITKINLKTLKTIAPLLIELERSNYQINLK